MALCRRAAGRSLGLFQTTLPKAAPSTHRAFISLTTSSFRPSQSHPPAKYQYRRNLNTSAERSITGQEAPSAQAYIKSGVLSGKKDLVDVKKVLVIGSGGLSIGQAGEFDYSGMYDKVLTMSKGPSQSVHHRRWRGEWGNS